MNMATIDRQIGGVTIVDISGRIELGEESAAMRDIICDLLSKGHKQILLNLGGVEYIDSAGLDDVQDSASPTQAQIGSRLCR